MLIQWDTGNKKNNYFSGNGLFMRQCTSISTAKHKEWKIMHEMRVSEIITDRIWM